VALLKSAMDLARRFGGLISVWQIRDSSDIHLSYLEPLNMKNLLKIVKNFARDESGASAIEYGLLASLIALGIVVGATALGTSLNTLFNDIAGQL
jgi:pilus assembly protein Flp/PilA